MDKTTKFDIFKSWFVRDKRSYWWNKFSDYELELSRMSLTELASELNRTKVRGEPENTIIVEYILQARIARLQSRASWWSGWLSFAGAMIAAALTIYLGQLSVSSKNDAQVISPLKYESEVLSIEKPAQTVTPTIQEKAPKNESIKNHNNNSNDGQQ